MKSRKNIIFSTDPDWENKEKDDTLPVQKTQGVIYLLRDRKGRGGKTVTVVQGYKGDAKTMLKRLQKLCGGGGSVKNGNLEVQGDHRDKISAFLSAEGYNVKFKGG